LVLQIAMAFTMNQRRPSQRGGYDAS
jgi:hypothetical protein